MPGKLRSFLNAVFGPPKPVDVGDGYKPLTPLDSTTTLTDQKPVAGVSASDIGFAVGMAGGDVYRAAQVQYILSRVVPPGQKPTSDQIGKIVGMLGGGISEAVIIDAILKGK